MDEIVLRDSFNITFGMFPHQRRKGGLDATTSVRGARSDGVDLSGTG